MLTNMQVPNTIGVQTNVIPMNLTTSVIDETARGIALFYKDKHFVCQTFFTQPVLGEINLVEGLETRADVHIRSIQLIGPNVFHVPLLGTETKVREMCRDVAFYELLRGIRTTLTKDIRSRRYLELNTTGETWNCLVSVDKMKFHILNNVWLNKKMTSITNIILLGDRLLGLTTDHKVVMGQIRTELIESDHTDLKVELMETINKLGRISLLTKAPNSDDNFLITVENTIYQFNIRGEMLHFNTLDEKVKQINSITFNHTRSIMATSNGLYEMDVTEMPNMVRATSLPRQIINPHLNDNFRLALYVDDPYILGIEPGLGIFAKNDKEEVLFF